MFSPLLFRFSKPNSFLVLLFFLSFFNCLPCALSQREPCDTLFRCGNLTAGFPFWGVARPQPCGHPSLGLHCNKQSNSTSSTSLIISGLMYRVLEVNITNSTTLKLVRQDFSGPFCSASFSGATLAPELFELLPDYKTLSAYYLCNPHLHYPANFTCPNKGVGLMYQDDLYHNNCGGSFNITVPIGYAPEEEGLNVTNLESVLKKGFEVKLSIDERPCKECKSTGGICAYQVATPVCCKTNSSSELECIPMIPSGSNIGLSKKAKIGIGFASGFLGATLIGGCLFCIFIRRRKKLAAQYTSKGLSTTTTYSMSNTPTSTTISGSNHSLVPSMSNLAHGSVYFGVQVFSYEELEEATENFSKELGDGGFGTVYYGVLKDGRAVAVKRLFERSLKRVEQFKNEIEILKSLKHPNLVILYGCTTRHSRELLLVYEYISNGTLAEHLHGNQAQSRPICWPARLQIAIETASALSYLHTSGIIHRDVKTTNILLDSNYQVKVADFGLSRLFPTDQTHISTAPQGTPGYVDPEYYQCYRLNEKSDVYSFGVVLSELISSKEAVDITRHRHDINLANMAISKIQNDAVHELADLSLGFARDPSVKKMMSSVAELAFRCLQQEREVRPSMDEIVEILKGIQKEGIKDSKDVVVEIDVNGGDDVGLLKHGVPPPLSPETDKTTASSSNTTASSF
ncbi:LEAF RUST 10 DISEASE-RESISTANCE LOCUS RECEPTOR-LIKE PROTEIN KINASE-like 1.3 isoform X2 [Arabidopsis lyrata subsp. lyrata]|uniref:LEAF RUST 10 DISEASE-RESISTANCE LOCUS RECEPTOR-LIKE PROTEIN KINASE-like 1.3 isoform X2 n=1 Tax=Arabidopsis lyrata subsp. lyrata TaxID=81972 RepID=UPI000A29AFAF|nr:LEAF RUST 10 DISEASE-RESISTANCE LOCUS RECEPTOR-LIKE PROTEIN KINASE-like 1.3 isoform X2 [Arabidopsis lyrata subsp. lyrata]|eukprot:XP_020873158.1 LEAF RUST 10 DISEASE-RESISTANCE LOCUS RECEPTOR-LIKE PROTEIN KINASE-like 1.3 isoform X2 [Arabidopsis lyrata subsp. lyrata]